MNWKLEAVEKLRQYEAKKQSLKSIPEEIKRLESVICSIRSAAADSVPVSRSGSNREDMMLSNIVHQEELKRALDQAKRWVEVVEGALRVLEVDERLVLERLYINSASGNIDRLCDELSVEKSSVYRRRDAALCRFTKALYGCTEN